MTMGVDDATSLRSSIDSHSVIKGRRWRRTDPALNEHVRQSLVDELMDARRAVKAALACDDEEELRAARSRVDDAKVGLGERGPKWWVEMTDNDVGVRTRAARRALNSTRSDSLSHEAVARMLDLRT